MSYESKNLQQFAKYRQSTVSNKITSHSNSDEKASSSMSRTIESGIFECDDWNDVSVSYKSSIVPRRYRSSIDITSDMLNAGFADVSPTSVNTVSKSREKEKFDMRSLNERFGEYIDNLRDLEAQRKLLTTSLDELSNTLIRNKIEIEAKYRSELEAARGTLTETNEKSIATNGHLKILNERILSRQKKWYVLQEWRDLDLGTINKRKQQAANLNVENKILERNIESLKEERTKFMKTITKLREQLKELRIAINEETISRFDAENKYQTLQEELEFLKCLHKKEMEVLSALSFKHITAKNHQFWKNELSLAVRDIQQVYDLKVDQSRGDMEMFYKMKLEEFCNGATRHNREATLAREKTKRLQKELTEAINMLQNEQNKNANQQKQFQDELSEREQRFQKQVIVRDKLRHEKNNHQKEYEKKKVQVKTLINVKLSLEQEIAAYRKLLEGEETWVSLRKIVEQSLRFPQSDVAQLPDAVCFIQNESHVGSTNTTVGSRISDKYSESSQTKITRTHYTQLGNHTVQPKLSNKIAEVVDTIGTDDVQQSSTFSSSNTGSISIAKVHREGKYITLENISSGDQRLNGWKIKHTVDNDSRKYEFTFDFYELKHGKSVKIFAKSCLGLAGQGDVVFYGADKWGTGPESVTTLIDRNGEEKAKFILKSGF